MDENPYKSPIRLLFRFSLRTLFLLLTVLCIWLGREVRLVRQRQLAIEEMKSHRDGWVQVLTDRSGRFDQRSENFLWCAGIDPVKSTIPQRRRALGDVAVGSITYSKDTSPDDIQRWKPLFPEATWYDLGAMTPSTPQ